VKIPHLSLPQKRSPEYPDNKKIREETGLEKQQECTGSQKSLLLLNGASDHRMAVKCELSAV